MWSGLVAPWRASLGAQLEPRARPLRADRNVERTVACQRHCGQKSVADEIAERGRVRVHGNGSRSPQHDGDRSTAGFGREEELRPRDAGRDVGREVFWRSEIGERLEERVDASDAVAHRLQMALDRSAALVIAQPIAEELQVQHHVVQRVLPLVRESGGGALQEERALG